MALGVRRELLEQRQAIDLLYARGHAAGLFERYRDPTIAEVAERLRTFFAADPIKAEQAVGSLYGHYFRRCEERYDRR